MKTTKIAALLALGLALVSGSAMAENALDRYNATLNSPAAKAQLLRSTCASANGANLALCDRWTRTGVPDSEVRVGIVATAGVVGAGAGFVAAAVPFGALGGNTLISQWGVTSIAGWAPTVAVVGTTGAVTGVALGGTSFLAR